MIIVKKDLYSIRTSEGKISFDSVKVEKTFLYTTVKYSLVGGIKHPSDKDDYRIYDFVNLKNIKLYFMNFKDPGQKKVYKELLGTAYLFLYFSDLEMDLTKDVDYKIQIFYNYNFNSHEARIYIYTFSQWRQHLYGTKVERNHIRNYVLMEELTVEIKNNEIIINLNA